MEDIKNNFKVIHIDPSIPPKKNMIISTKDILDRAFELMNFVMNILKNKKRNCIRDRD